MTKSAALPATTEVRTPPLAIQIADQLERDIIAGKYQPGERLREIEIAQRTGVSRGPVREAFRIVEQDGMIENEPWKGLRVVDLDTSELSDLMDLVAALQGLIARLAASHATSQHLSALADLIDRMDEIVEAGGPMNEQLRLAFEAGALLREACGSRRAASIMTRVGRLAYWQHRHLLGADLSWRREAVKNWRRLHEMLSRGNPTASDRQAHIMVEHSKRNILKSFRQAASAVLLPLPNRMESLPVAV